MMKNLPNYITALRIIGTLCLIWIEPFTAAFLVVYSLSGISDILDGWVARRTKTASESGAKLDSIADLLFYAVMLIKIFPVLWSRVPMTIWYVTGTALMLRLASYALAAVKYRRFASLHTYLNKLTGGAVFLIPYMLQLPIAVPFCWCVCIIALVASGEELLIHVVSKGYDANRKTFIPLKKAF